MTTNNNDNTNVNEHVADPSTSNLRNTKTVITTHDETTGTAIAHTVTPASWTEVRPHTRFNVVYTTSEFPVNMNAHADIHTHEQVMASGKLGLVRPKGTVCRMVDFSPSNEALMHRTQSLDFGVLIEGEIEMLLDSGEVHLLKKGDVAVQRATMHAWRNPSKTEWARMLFVLQDCQPLTVGGQIFREDLTKAKGGIPDSGNDQ